MAADLSLKDRLRDLLLRSRVPVRDAELRKALGGVLQEDFRQAVDALRADGLVIQNRRDGYLLVRNVAPEPKVSKIDTAKFAGKRLRFGVTADNHLASKYARLDVLNALFDIWHADGITEVLQLGNIVDGECRFNQYDLLVRGLDAQVSYLIENWPKREGMVTRFICGDDHEGWWLKREGIDIGCLIETRAERAGRTDLKYLGYMEHDLSYPVPRKPAQVIRLVHGGGGSSRVAYSYEPQQLINSYEGGEKPRILLIGHFHKFNVTWQRNCLAVSAGSTMSQSPWMRKRRLASMMGGVTLEVDMGQDGSFHRMRTEWHPFYDDAYYREWKFQGV